ncbi:MAG: hypothetical protein AAFZ80_09940 [Cyanobacteria bacterium P01_A01_bin.105]
MKSTSEISDLGHLHGKTDWVVTPRAAPMAQLETAYVLPETAKL